MAFLPGRECHPLDYTTLPGRTVNLSPITLVEGLPSGAGITPTGLRDLALPHRGSDPNYSVGYSYNPGYNHNTF